MSSAAMARPNVVISLSVQELKDERKMGLGCDCDALEVREEGRYT